MKDKLIDEYKKRRFEFYKKILITVSENCEGGSLVNRRQIDKTSFLNSALVFCEKTHAEEFYSELVGELERYWKVNKVGNLSLKTSKPLYNIAMTVTKWSYANHNEEELEEIALLKRVINFLDEDSKKVFVDFDLLNEILNDLPFTRNERADLMMQIIRLNNERFKSGDVVRPYSLDAIDDNVKHVFYRPILDSLLNFNMLDEIDELDIPFKKSMIKRINKVNEMYPLDTSDIETNCNEVISLIDGENILDEMVRERIQKSLEYLQCPYVYNVLAGRESKRVRQQELEISRQQKKSEVEEVKKDNKQKQDKLSKKEINSILREISEVYDFENNECLKYLTMDEIIKYVSMLIRTNADEKTIGMFIHSAEKYMRQNTVGAYFEMLDKMKSISTNATILSYIDEAELLVDELYNNASSEEKCTQIIEELDELIRNINNSFGNDYSYELGKALELVGRM